MRRCTCGETFDLDLLDAEWAELMKAHRGTFGHQARMLNHQVHGLGDVVMAWFGSMRDEYLCGRYRER